MGMSRTYLYPRTSTYPMRLSTYVDNSIGEVMVDEMTDGSLGLTDAFKDWVRKQEGKQGRKGR